MKLNYAKPGTHVLNKIDGKEYVVNLDGDRKLLYPYTEEEIDVSEITPIELTEANAICFRYLFTPGTPDIPEGCWDAIDGTLTKDGQPVCEQGSLYVKNVLCKIPGAVILTVKNSCDHDSVVVYKPERDRFATVLTVPENTCDCVDHVNDGAILAWSKYDHVEIETENGEKETKTVFVEAGNAFISRNSTYLIEYDVPANVSIVQIIDDKFIAVQFTSEIRDGFVEEKKTVDYVVYDLKGEEMTSFCLDSAAKICVNKVDYTFFARGKDFIETEKGLFHSKELEGKEQFVDLIDVTKDGNKSIYTFADEKYNILRIQREFTSDRGVIDKIL
jgi:hypothetical protein